MPQDLAVRVDGAQPFSCWHALTMWSAEAQRVRIQLHIREHIPQACLADAEDQDIGGRYELTFFVSKAEWETLEANTHFAVDVSVAGESWNPEEVDYVLGDGHDDAIEGVHVSRHQLVSHGADGQRIVGTLSLLQRHRDRLVWSTSLDIEWGNSELEIDGQVPLQLQRSGKPSDD